MQEELERTDVACLKVPGTESQLWAICAALPVTTSEIQPEIEICHFHTGSMPLNCITILILMYYF